MKVVTPEDIKGKKVLLRLDLDVPLRLRSGSSTAFEVVEDFRLKAGLPTLKLCIENASKVIIIGHMGRPAGPDPVFSLDPVREWYKQNGFPQVEMLENLRFDPGEESLNMDFAKKLAGLADIFVFEAFASYRPAVSTTVLPTLLPHFAGLRFAKEIEILTGVLNNPKKPFVAIMGGAKVEDKLPVIEVLAKKADAVLVGGKLVAEIREQDLDLPSNVLIGKLTGDGFDVAPETIDSWKPLLLGAAMIVWNGPVGRIEDPNKAKENLGSAKGTYDLAKLILESQAEVIIGGGDTIAFLDKTGLLEKFKDKGFVSTGGGAMLKFLVKGTLETIEALNA